MRTFSDTTGSEWIASAREEETPRHHGRWFLTFRTTTAGAPADYALPEIRWQNRQTAERTIRTMSDGELRRRLDLARARSPRGASTAPVTAAR